MDVVENVNNELQKAVNNSKHELLPAVDKMISAFNEYKRRVAEFEDLNEASNITAQKLREENDILIKKNQEFELNNQALVQRNEELVKRIEELEKEITFYKD